jgi:hypothetical protein
MLKNNNIEKAVLDQALKAFNTNAAPEVRAQIAGQQPHLNENADYLLQIDINEKKLLFAADVKANITEAHVGLIVHVRKNEVRNPYLLVAGYINERMADRLRQAGIQFIDAAGNAYINTLPVYIFVKGNRMPDMVKPPQIGRAFKPTGLLVLYAFFCNPGLENKPYREIAAAANVALGTVGWIMRELKELGYLLDMGKKGFKLTRKKELLQRWVTEYPEKLRPKLLLGRFKDMENNLQQTDLNPYNAQWGGEIAAAKLTQYLKPQNIIIYMVPDQLNQFLAENRLRKDQEGDIEILERFWGPLKEGKAGATVHPLLVYADLLATGNQRNIETAIMIHEQYIAQLIRED